MLVPRRVSSQNCLDWGVDMLVPRRYCIISNSLSPLKNSEENPPPPHSHHSAQASWCNAMLISQCSADGRHVCTGWNCRVVVWRQDQHLRAGGSMLPDNQKKNRCENLWLLQNKHSFWQGRPLKMHTHIYIYRENIFYLEGKISNFCHVYSAITSTEYIALNWWMDGSLIFH